MEAKLNRRNDEQMIEGCPDKYGSFDSRLRTHRGVSHAAVARPSLLGGSRRRQTARLMPTRRPRVGANSDAPRNGTAKARAARSRPGTSGPTGDGPAAPAAFSTRWHVLAAGADGQRSGQGANQQVRLAAELKGELVDRPQAIAHVFKLARSERDAWLNWPHASRHRWQPSSASIPVTMQYRLRRRCVSTCELGEMRPRVD